MFNIASRFYNRPLMVDKNFCQFLSKASAESFDVKPPEPGAVGFLSAKASEMRSEDGLAYVYVSGSLYSGLDYGYHGYFTGYDYISQSIQAANNNPTVKGIALIVGSHGGEVTGCFECADVIANSEKPVYAIVESYAHSAGYALASKASKISMPKTGSVGSVGVVTMHGDYSRMLENNGIKVTMMFAGKHKVDGNPYEPLADSVKADTQTRLEEIRNIFVESVASGRDIESTVVYDTEAKTYGPSEALSLGLVDAELSPKAAIEAFKLELFGSKTKERSVSMKHTAQEAEAKTPEASDEPTFGQGKTAERARVKAILSSTEASSRSKLANHLAFDTDMSAESAIALMANAASEKAETSTVQQNDFAAAMNSGNNPEVGAGVTAQKSEQSDEMSAFALLDKTRGRKSANQG
jgi:signal peptide peptidase SppA